MSAQMQQHKAQVRKTMRQASSENTFALEELADELLKAMRVHSIEERRYALAREFTLTTERCPDRFERLIIGARSLSPIASEPSEPLLGEPPTAEISLNKPTLAEVPQP